MINNKTVLLLKFFKSAKQKKTKKVLKMIYYPIKVRLDLH